MDRERSLDDAIEALLESYRRHGNINHPEATALPSRVRVKQILDDLMDLVFPGYFGKDPLHELTSAYVLAERCARSYRDLASACTRAFRCECGATPISEQRAQDLDAQGRQVAMSLLESLPRVRDVLSTDVQAALLGDPAASNPDEVILSYPGMQAITSHRLAHELYRLCVPMLPRMMSEVTHSRTGIDIHPGATIGPSFFIDHGTGVVMGETTEIGSRVKLYQGVTLGALSVRGGREKLGGKKRHPTLEDDVTIYAGATILGGETVIGRGSTIGGNVWLTHSVAPNTTVVLDKPSLLFKQGS
jgi:serine O-acetyltransferase